MKTSPSWFQESHLPLALKWMLCSRQDLMAHEFHLEGRERQFLQWLVRTGFQEYPALAARIEREVELNEWFREESELGNGLSRIELAIWDTCKLHRKCCRLPGLAQLYHLWLKLFWPANRRSLPKRNVFFERSAKNLEPLQETTRPFGVNLIGYATYALGVGEDLRTTYHALEANAVPTTVIDFAPGDRDRARELSLQSHLSREAPYSFTLLCMTAEETARYVLYQGTEHLEGRYIIGYWPWELENWPDEWIPLLDLVNEVWVSTHHIAMGLRAATSKPVQVMPLCVDSPDPELRALDSQQRTSIRDRFVLPEKDILFFFSFDLDSSIERKNPWGALTAFQRAYPHSDSANEHPNVGLVIKTFSPKQANASWEELKEIAAADPRIRIVEANLSRFELLSLMGACDALLSLHRAEGFGRGLAEALKLGLDVIATDWSGNTDFCSGHLAHPVPYELVPVPPGAYPFHKGQRWAEPDLDAAADIIRSVVEKRASAAPDQEWTGADYADQFSMKTCGARYRSRLEELHQIQ
ncbi:MAG: glycosyltransferase [Verrucomicrobiota bacterium]